MVFHTQILRRAAGLALILCFITSPSKAETMTQSGLTLHTTRIIYPASAKKGVTISLTNNTEYAYLMQSWLRHVDMATGQVDSASDSEAENAAAPIPFMVLPPLVRAAAGEKITLLIRKTGNDLPGDRESVFFVSVKAIPALAQENKQIGNQLVVAVVNNLKLFYRPEGLPEDGIIKASPLLRFSRQGDVLIVDNPTPFYLSFARLAIGGRGITPAERAKMVPPKGQQRYTLTAGSEGSIEWQLVDENSGMTPIQRQSL